MGLKLPPLDEQSRGTYMLGAGGWRWDAGAGCGGLDVGTQRLGGRDLGPESAPAARASLQPPAFSSTLWTRAPRTPILSRPQPCPDSSNPWRKTRTLGPTPHPNAFAASMTSRHCAC